MKMPDNKSEIKYSLDMEIIIREGQVNEVIGLFETNAFRDIPNGKVLKELAVVRIAMAVMNDARDNNGESTLMPGFVWKDTYLTFPDEVPNLPKPYQRESLGNFCEAVSEHRLDLARRGLEMSENVIEKATGLEELQSGMTLMIIANRFQLATRAWDEMAEHFTPKNIGFEDLTPATVAELKRGK